MKQLIARIFKKQHQSWRVYYTDGTRTYRLRYSEAVDLAIAFDGRVEYEPA